MQTIEVIFVYEGHYTRNYGVTTVMSIIFHNVRNIQLGISCNPPPHTTRPGQHASRASIYINKGDLSIYACELVSHSLQNIYVSEWLICVSNSLGNIC